MLGGDNAGFYGRLNMQGFYLLFLCFIFVMCKMYGEKADDFSELKNSVRNSISSTAVSLAEDYIQNNEVTSAQVKELIDNVSFEDYKVELAKFAYFYVKDKEDYLATIKGSLFFSSFDKVEQHVKSRPSFRTGNLPALIADLKVMSSSRAYDKVCRYIDQYTVTSQDIAHILDQIAFEDTKFQIAKYAYPQIADKKVYLQTLYTNLRLSTYRNLEKYIQKIDSLK